MKNLSFVFFFVALLSACRYPEVKKESPQLNELKAGEKFRITLPEEHDSGQLWQLEQDYDTRVVEKLNTAWHGNEKGVDFNFRALAAGSTTLTLLKRMYTDTSEIKRFIITITGN